MEHAPGGSFVAKVQSQGRCLSSSSTELLVASCVKLESSPGLHFSFHILPTLSGQLLLCKCGSLGNKGTMDVNNLNNMFICIFRCVCA